MALNEDELRGIEERWTIDPSLYGRLGLPSGRVGPPSGQVGPSKSGPLLSREEWEAVVRDAKQDIGLLIAEVRRLQEERP